jgi:hypothetical protein
MAPGIRAPLARVGVDLRNSVVLASGESYGEVWYT